MAAGLPIEVVAHIMSFLGVPDQKEAALVCRAWYEASLDPVLQRNITFNFTFEKTGDILESFQRRRLTHLILSHFDNSNAAKAAILKACELRSDDLLSLSLKDSNIMEGTFVQLLSRCPHLENLDLSGCNSLFMAGMLFSNNAQFQQLQATMKYVKCLKLSSLRYLSDCSFNRIVSIFPNLGKLSLASTHITYNGHPYYPEESTAYENSAVFTFRNLEHYISDNVARIKSLDLSRTAISNQHLGQLACIAGLQLEELVLVCCRDIGNEGISQLCQHQTKLKHLNLNGCQDISDTGLTNIATHLSHLEVLRMNKCRQVTDSSVGMLKNLERLKELDMSECYEVTGVGIIHGVCSIIKSHVVHLNLSCCSKVDTSAVVKIAQCLPLLQHLDLGSCFLLQDTALHMISSSLHRLRYLRLAWCKAITDAGLLGLEPEGICPLHDPVTAVIEGECSCIRKSNVPVIFRKPTAAIREKNEAALKKMIADLEKTVVPQNLSALAYLQNLDLSSCPQLTDLGLQTSIRFRELRVLKLNMLHGVTDAGLTDIAENNPGLEELQLEQCARLTDVAIGIVTALCPRLTHLNISSCDRLTNESLHHIQRNCKRLRYLDISFCCGISPQAVEQFEGKMTLPTLLKRNVGISGNGANGTFGLKGVRSGGNLTQVL